MEGLTVGRIVHYVLGIDDVEAINRRRVAYPTQPAYPAGTQVHVGNPAQAGDHCAMMIVKVWRDGSINGQVFLDGSDVLWVTSVEHSEPGGVTESRTWHWVERA